MIIGPLNFNKFVENTTFDCIEETSKFLNELEYIFIDEAKNPKESKVSTLKKFFTKQKDFSSKLIKKQIAQLSTNNKSANNLVSTSSPYIYLYGKSKYFEYPMIKYNVCNDDYLNDIMVKYNDGLISIFDYLSIAFKKDELNDSKLIEKRVNKAKEEIEEEVQYLRGKLLNLDKKIPLKEKIDKYADEVFLVNGSKEPVNTLIDKNELHNCIDRLKNSYSVQKDILKSKEEYIKKNYDNSMKYLDAYDFLIIKCTDAKIDYDDRLDIYFDNDCISDYASLVIEYIKLLYNDYLKILSIRLSYLNDSFKQDESIVRKVINTCKK